MSNQYVRDLRAVMDQQTHIASEIGDQWRTPDWLYLALNELYGPFVFDMFTDGQNSKCPHYFTADDNALEQDWGAALEKAGGGKYFGNPPYSIKRARKGRKAPHLTGMTYVMKKAYEEHMEGVPGLFLAKSATAESWWPDELCSRIIHIKGRISFDLPAWYRPDPLAAKESTAGFGASLIIFDGESRHRFPEEYISREKLMEIGLPLAAAQAEQRAAWVRQWDEV